MMNQHVGSLHYYLFTHIEVIAFNGVLDTFLYFDGFYGKPLNKLSFQ